MIRKLCGDTPTKVHADLAVAFGENVPDLRTIQRWFSEAQKRRLSVEDLPRSGRPKNPDIDAAIQQECKQTRGISTRELAHNTGIPQTTVLEHLRALGYQYLCNRWIPHVLSDDQKSQRVETSADILFLLTTSPRGTMFVTGDESWIYFDNRCGNEWVAPDEEPQTIPKRGVFSEKIMVTVFFSQYGIHMIDFLPQGQRFNTVYFIEHCLRPLARSLTEQRPVSGAEKVFVHFDNARPHTSKASKAAMKELGLRQMSQPPFSPDISPCDFFLFGALKQRLQGTIAHSREELIENVTKILSEIDKSVFASVIEELKTRLTPVIEGSGEYLQ